MHHYPHHIGDFDRATRHLSRLERSIYRDLIELYYITESPINLDLDLVCRKIIARSNEERTAVEQTLNEFFTKTERGWVNWRCEDEIEAYRANASQKSIAGKASAEARRNKKLQMLNSRSTAVQQPLSAVATKFNGDPTNQEPRTINQEPLTNSITTSAPATKKKTRIDENLELSDDWKNSALEYWQSKSRFDINPADQFFQFKNHHLGKGTLMVSWSAAWRTWYANAVEYTRPPLQVIHASQQAAPRPIKTMRPAGSEQ